MENIKRNLLYGDKVYLRPITDEDTPLIIKWRNNPKVRKNFVFRELFNEEIHNKWMREKVKTGEVVQFIICEKVSQEEKWKTKERPVGTNFLQHIDKEKLEADYGFLIGEDDARGKGYGREATELAKQYAKEVMGLKSLTAKIIVGNTASEKSLKNAGLKIIELRRNVKCSDKTEVDMIFTKVFL